MEIGKDVEELNWRKSLKPGDKFAFKADRMYPPSIFEVVRTTKTLIVALSSRGQHVRFTIDYGKMYGANTFARIMPTTQEIIDAHDTYAIKQWLNTLQKPTADVTVNQLRAMKAAYEATK